MPNVKVRLDADGSRFNTVMNSAMAKVGSFGKHMASTMGGMMLANFGTAAIQRAVDSTVKLAGTLAELRKELGVVEEDLYALRKASIDAGGSVENVSAAFRALGIARRKALSGDVNKIGLFKELGIGQESLKNLTPIQLAKQVAAGLEDKSVSGKANLMTQLTNKKVATSFIPMQEALVDFEKYKTDRKIPKQESFNTLDKLDATLDDLKNVIETQLITVLAGLTDTIIKWIDASVGWYERFTARRVGEAEFVRNKYLQEHPGDEIGANKSARNHLAYGAFNGGMLQDFFASFLGKGNIYNPKGMEEAGQIAVDIKSNEIEKRKRLRDEAYRKRQLDRENALTAGDDFISIPKETKESSLKDFKAKQREMAAGQGGVAVGNFLGSSVNILQQLATETNDYLSQIRDYTRQMAEKQAATNTIPDEGDIVE